MAKELAEIGDDFLKKLCELGKVYEETMDGGLRFSRGTMGMLHGIIESLYQEHTQDAMITMLNMEQTKRLAGSIVDCNPNRTTHTGVAS